jgi:hypothetical protein
MRRTILAAAALLALAFAVAACGSKHSVATVAPGTPGAPPSPNPSAQQTAGRVTALATQIGKELTVAPGTSSNPYDYLPYCPAYRKLVALGPPALPAIARYILDHKAHGLDGYVMAIAGDAIWGSHGTPIAAGAKSWETSGQWARQYLAWAQEHPSSN